MNRGGWLAPSLTLARSFSFFREHDEPTLDNNNEAPRSSFFISSVGRSHSTSHAIPLAQCLYEDGAHDARGLCYFLIFVASALLLKRVGPAEDPYAHNLLYPIVHIVQSSKYSSKDTIYFKYTHTHTEPHTQLKTRNAVCRWRRALLAPGLRCAQSGPPFGTWLRSSASRCVHISTDCLCSERASAT